MSETTETSTDTVVEQTVPNLRNIAQRAKQLATRTPDGFLAFGFGSGLLTSAPGTMGTLAAVPIAVLLAALGISPVWFIALTFLLGVWLCERVSRRLGVEDYSGIVWDEMVGYWLAVAFVPFEWGWFLAAFILFRAFDILKPWPISLVEESFDGGFAIMLDDVLAALYTALILAFIEIRIFGA